MAVEYPQVIAAIKEWIGKNKISTDSMVEISGQNAARQATLGEMLLKFAGDAFSAVMGGSSVLPGDTKLADGSIVPGALRQAVLNIGDQVKGIMGSISSGIGSALGDVGKFVYQNPASFDTELFNAYSSIDPQILLNMDPDVRIAFEEAVQNAKPDGLWNIATQNWNSFTDQLSGVSIPATDGFTFKEAISLGIDKTNQFFSAITGIKKFDVVDLASCIMAPAALAKFTNYHDQLMAAATMPAVTAAEIAAQKKAINDASAGMTAAANEMNAQIAADKAAYAQAIAQKNAIDMITNEGDVYNIIMNDTNITDDQKNVYISTLQAATLNNAKRVSNLMTENKNSSVNIPTIT